MFTRSDIGSVSDAPKEKSTCCDMLAQQVTAALLIHYCCSEACSIYHMHGIYGMASSAC